MICRSSTFMPAPECSKQLPESYTRCEMAERTAGQIPERLVTNLAIESRRGPCEVRHQRLRSRPFAPTVNGGAYRNGPLVLVEELRTDSNMGQLHVSQEMNGNASAYKTAVSGIQAKSNGPSVGRARRRYLPRAPESAGVQTAPPGMRPAKWWRAERHSAQSAAAA